MNTISLSCLQHKQALSNNSITGNSSNICKLSTAFPLGFLADTLREVKFNVSPEAKTKVLD